MKDIDEIKKWLHSVRYNGKTHGVRLTHILVLSMYWYHQTNSVVENTIKDLTIHGDEFDMMGLSRTPYNKLNIHCNGVYGDKLSTMDRFCKNFERLPESVQTRLTVENDDKAQVCTQ